MTASEQPERKQRRIAAGSFEPSDGPNYALPGVAPVPVPQPPRIPPPLLFGLILAVVLGAGGVLLFSSHAPSEELTAEKLVALVHEQEEATRANAATVAASRTGSAVLSVETDPAGAEVVIDGTAAGESPVRRDRLPAQWYVLSIRKDGYQPVDSLVHLGSGQRMSLSVTLTPSDPLAAALAATLAEAAPLSEAAGLAPALLPTAPRQEAQPPRRAEPLVSAPRPEARTGSVQVTTNLDGVAVSIDGRRIGTTPLRPREVTPGAHVIELSLSGHQAQRLTVSVGAGQINTVHAAMVPEPKTVPETKAAPEAPAPRRGSLSVVAQPWGSIYIDGTLRARDTDLRYETELPVGDHQVRVEHPTLGTWERTVRVTADRPVSLRADLTSGTP